MQQDACGPMVSRATELARLLSLLDSVAAGEAAVALVSGEAGVGKTRLVTELVRRARERGFCVLTGRCAELGDSVPYLPLADALRSVIGDASARVAELVADRPVLGRLLPDHGPGTPAGGDGWELARQQLFGAVLGLLTELAEANPVLLVLEDLHWADRSTRDLVTFLSRVEQLSGPAQQALRAAAVSGRRVDDELVMAASGLSAPEYEEAIREAVAAQLLAPDGQEGYMFRHALLREAIYADLLPGERTRLHATLAGLLSGGSRLESVPGSAAELAHHCLASHDIAGAFAASVRAGQEAERLAAPAEAHRHYDQALALWDRVDDPEKLGGMDRVRLALRSATNAAASGDVPRAVHQLRRVASVLAEAPGDPHLACRVNERLAF